MEFRLSKNINVPLHAVIDAIIKAESNDDPNAISPVGAKGLMQLMDATGREWHERLKLSSAYDPFNPSQNKVIGTAYFVWLYEQFGDVPTALAAYNWGIGNVDNRLKMSSSKNFLEILDKLPKETLYYVAKVLRFLRKKYDW